MGAFSWDKVDIQTENGVQQGIAPVIISASRVTDIPAFYAEWFISRLQAGYVIWTNPFNRRPQYVSLEQARVAVFWTKNPQPLIPYLQELDSKGINYYFNFTLNDYVQEGLEPSVPGLMERIAVFRLLSSMLGRDRVVWRFDPLILVDNLDVDSLLCKVEKVGEYVHPYTRRLVISFADIGTYARVKRNLTRDNYAYREFDTEAIRQFAAGLQALNRKWGLEISTCAEEIDLSDYGITHSSCVDGGLIERLFSHDAVLMGFLRRVCGAQTALFDRADGDGVTGVKLKDKGQRVQCRCIVSKDIGMYNTCRHRCVYCYANDWGRALHRLDE